MSWQSLGAVIPIESQWRALQPTTQSTSSPVESLPYRITGLNVAPFDADKFYALVRFKYGADVYSRAFPLGPSSSPKLFMVTIPPAITTFPFSWVPQVQLVVYGRELQRPSPVNWAIQLDEFLEPDVNAISLLNLSRFLY